MDKDLVAGCEALAEAGDQAAVVAMAQSAMALHASDAAAQYRLGMALARVERPDLAEAAMCAVLGLQPENLDALIMLGLLLRDQGKWDDATTTMRRACALAPQHAFARHSLGELLLTQGHYEEGMPARLAGRNSVVPETRLMAPSWLGEPLFDLDGSRGTLLLLCDGGLGDAIMLARYVPICAERARVVIAGPPALRRLFATLPGLAHYAAAPPLPTFHRQLPMEHLPLVWGTTLENVPNNGPYLSADPALARRFAERLDALPGRRVGLAWAGNPDFGGDAIRSVTLASLEPLLAVPGTSFVSLQVGAPAAQAAAYPAVMDWSAELGDMADTAALIAGLDLVITVDTAVVHLAGALGKPVWLLNRLNTDWRWALGRNDSPWYPTLRQFRQTRLGDWSEPVRQAAASLAALPARDRFHLTESGI
jgi:hypothetical protein